MKYDSSLMTSYQKGLLSYLAHRKLASHGCFSVWGLESPLEESSSTPIVLREEFFIWLSKTILVVFKADFVCQWEGTTFQLISISTVAGIGFPLDFGL